MTPWLDFRIAEDVVTVNPLVETYVPGYDLQETSI